MVQMHKLQPDNLIAPTQYRIGQVVKINVSYGFPYNCGFYNLPLSGLCIYIRKRSV